jgi:hypothetical protein
MDTGYPEYMPVEAIRIPGPQSPNLGAVLIGIGKFDCSAISPLTGALNDVQAMRELLLELGVPGGQNALLAAQFLKQIHMAPPQSEADRDLRLLCR